MAIANRRKVMCDEYILQAKVEELNSNISNLEYRLEKIRHLLTPNLSNDNINELQDVLKKIEGIVNRKC